MTHRPLLTVVVMPCLNEADLMTASVASLGFAATNPPSDSHLILVDNGSTDGTLAIGEALRDGSSGLVDVVQEPLRGHVPARHCGNVAAAAFAKHAGVLANDVLIIQADADTTYSAGYVHVVRDAIANEGSPGCIAQARTAWPSGFEADYPNVFGAVEAIDLPIRGQFGRHRDDVLVDDKACSYMLGDYLKWGGHRREYFASGEEVLAETTRLLIAARAQGGSRTDLLAATATHSQRRMLEDAAQPLAAAGFPYSQRRMFAADPHLPLGTLEARLRAGDDRAFKRIGEVRAAYLTALTVVLPAHLARTLQGPDPDSVAATRMAGALPVRTSLEAAERPSRLLEDVLTPVWQKEFDTCL